MLKCGWNWQRISSARQAHEMRSRHNDGDDDDVDDNDDDDDNEDDDDDDNDDAADIGYKEGGRQKNGCTCKEEKTRITRNATRTLTHSSKSVTI